MIVLYSWSTPNGRKISILLEELQLKYKVINIDITRNEQFNKEFASISPTNKIPAILDKENNKRIFESGAILQYLAKKYNKFIDNDYYWEIINWLSFQISQIGPLLGQAHQFMYYNPGKSKYAEEKYINYAKRIYLTLDKQLSKNEYLANTYSIADIATWPWIARYELHAIDIHDYPNVLRWYKSIVKRSAVIKGYNVAGNKEEIPLI